ncbi:protein Abitram-like [Crassostrea angulata]|uniref:Actin-binding transcription modulator n=1 Tax=Magallana gigas TaxID=29159 RepID=A0A8W8MHT0_MAGGI|nr:protein Abitram-like [Crassostrea gigas]XP_052682304.1 protein Abitram-like [Crassostrea angulata]
MADDNQQHDFEGSKRLLESEHPSLVDRYYQSRYLIDSQSKKNEDICILTHSNRICIVTVAEWHPLLREKKTISQISYDVEGVNRMDNKISGKGKRGAQLLTPSSPLCEVTCTDGSKYIITCGVRGQLIEVNETLLKSPDLLSLKPQTEGYIAIVLPKLGDFEGTTKNLLSKDEYIKIRSSGT